MKYYSKDGMFVNVSLSHLEAHKEVLPFLEEALQKITTYKKSKIIKREVEFKNIIGVSTCVSINENDDIIFARRIGRKYETKFVKNKKPIPCNKLTIVLKRLSEYSLILLTAYIGSIAEKEVLDPKLLPHEKEKAINFWDSHALIYDESIIVKEEL